MRSIFYALVQWLSFQFKMKATNLSLSLAFIHIKNYFGADVGTIRVYKQLE